MTFSAHNPPASASRGGHFLRLRRGLRGIALLAVALAAPAADAGAAAVMAADQQDGYAGTMLEKVGRTWTPPDVKNPAAARVRVSVDGRGRLVSCTVAKASGHPALDASVCGAVKQIGEFGMPPYGMPIDVHLSFWTGFPNARPGDATAAASAPVPASATGQDSVTSSAKGAAPSPAPVAAAPAPQPAPATAAAPAPATATPAPAISGQAQDSYGPKYRKYFSNVVWKLKNSIFIPAETRPGTYRVTVRLEVDASGAIRRHDILVGSGDARLDKYVRQGLTRAGSVPPPPEGLGSTLDVTLSLKRQ